MGEETKDSTSTLATQGGIGLLGNLVGKILGFIFVAIATRLVSPSEYGIYVLALSIVTFIQGFASLSIHRSLDYFIPQYLSNSNYGQAKKTLKNAFLIGGVSSAVATILLILFREQVAGLFNENQLVLVLLLFALLIPLQTMYKIILTLFNSIKKIQYRVVMGKLVNPISRIIVAIILVTGGAGVFGLVGAYLVGVTLAIVFGIIFFLYEVSWFRGTEPQPISNKDLVSYSLPLLLAGVIYSLVGQIDFFIIGYFLSSAEVGYYQVAYLFAGNLLIVLKGVTPVFKPMIAEIKSDTHKIQDRFQLATRWITMLTLPMAITIILAADVYLSLFFTDEYTVASTALIVLVMGYLINAASGPEGMVLEGLGHTRLTLFNSTILVGINTALNVILVPQIGILGAGIATGTALAVAGLAGIIEIYILRGIHPYSLRLLRIYICTLLPISVGLIIIYFLDSQFAIAIVLPVAVTLSYVFGLIIINGFSEEDREIAYKLDSKLGYPIFIKIIR